MRGETGVNGFFNDIDRWFSNGETMEVDYENGSENSFGKGEVVGFFIDDKRRFVEIFLIRFFILEGKF